jgi:hypothetical protein
MTSRLIPREINDSDLVPIRHTHDFSSICTFERLQRAVELDEHVELVSTEFPAPRKDISILLGSVGGPLGDASDICMSRSVCLTHVSFSTGPQ